MPVARPDERAGLWLVVASSWTCIAALPVATGSNAGRAVALLLVGGAWLIAYASGYVRLAPLPRPVLVALGAAAAVVVVSALASPYAFRALTWGSIGYFGAPVWLALIMIVVGVASTGIPGDAGRGLAIVLGWTAVALAVAAADVLAGRPLVSTFNTGNTAAVVLVGAVPLTAWLGANGGATASRRMWTAISLVLAAAVVGTGSAAGILGLALALLALVILAPATLGLRTPRAVRTGRVAGATGGVLGVTVLAVGALAPGLLPFSLGAYLRDEVFGVTLSTRLEMWRAAGRILAAHPVLGTGPDTFHLAAQPFLPAALFELENTSGIAAVPPDPHSAVALVAASFGVIGLAVVAGMAVVWVRAAVLRRERELPQARDMRLAAAAGTLGSLVTLLFVPWAVITGGFVCVCAGLALAPTAPSAHAPASAAGPGTRAARIGAGLVGIAFVGLALLLIAGVFSFAAGLRAPDATSAAAAFDRSARFTPTYPYPRFRSLHATGSQLGASPDALAEWRARVDAEPSVAEDATFAFVLARDALDQAYRWGRTDVGWERDLLADAAIRFPNAPDLSLERAHLALVEGDAATARASLATLTGAASSTSRYDLYDYYLAVLEGDTARAAELRARLEAEFAPLALLAPQ